MNELGIFKKNKKLTKEEIIELDKDEQKKYFKKRTRRLAMKAMVSPLGMFDEVTDHIDTMVEVEFLTPEEATELYMQMNQKISNARETPGEILKNYKDKLKNELFKKDKDEDDE